MDENTRYQVLRNDEEQYSLWPLIEVPGGLAARRQGGHRSRVLRLCR